MTSRKLVVHPDPVLRRRALPVGQIDESVCTLVEHMKAIMKEEEGIGLAAPQAGESLRIFIALDGRKEGAQPIVFINPHLVVVDGPLEPSEEGCLSLPGIRANIRRQTHAVIEAQGLDGAVFRREDSGLQARCWQHEIDHLDGIMIIDRMTVMDRLVNRKQLRYLEAAGAAG